MRTLLFVLVACLSGASTSVAGINAELIELFSARHAAAMAPAKEGRIDEVDPFWNQSTGGMLFNSANAFSLEKNAFKKALRAATIEDWTFGMKAPWTPGKKTEWVSLDPFGMPFLAVSLIEDQPRLVRIYQVTAFAEGQATLGRTLQRYFRCELESKELADFFVTTAKTRARMKFTPESLSADYEKDAEDALRREVEQEAEQGSAGQPAIRSESNSEGDDKPEPESEGRPR